MIRRVTLMLLGTALLLGGLAVADDKAGDQPEPPVRLKKKNKAEVPEPGKLPGAEDKKPEKPKAGDAKDDPEPEPMPSDEDEKEIVARLAKDMRTSEERLGNKDLGDGTKQVQRDILKGLDSLIEQEQRPPESSDAADASSSPSAGSQKQGQQKQQQQRQARGNRRGSRNQTARGNKPGQSDERREGNDPSREDMAKGDNPTGSGGGNGKTGEANKLADMYKDIWGHLPESMRGEMNAYSREHFMAKYKDLIEQYYSTISEKGRHKGD